MFPHERNINTIDQITYHDPNSPIVLENVLPNLDGNLSMLFVIEVGMKIYTDPLMISYFLGPPTLVTSKENYCLWTVTHGSSLTTPHMSPLVPPLVTGNLWNNLPIVHIPFLFPPPRVVGTFVMVMLTINLPIWHLNP